jgi:hypothetical protein
MGISVGDFDCLRPVLGLMEVGEMVLQSVERKFSNFWRSRAADLAGFGDRAAMR